MGDKTLQRLSDQYRDEIESLNYKPEVAANLLNNLLTYAEKKLGNADGMLTREEVKQIRIATEDHLLSAQDNADIDAIVPESGMPIAEFINKTNGVHPARLEIRNGQAVTPSAARK